MKKLVRKVYESPVEKKRDFWLGIGLSICLNVVLLVLGLAIIPGRPLGAALSSGDGTGGPPLSLALQAAGLLINLGLPIHFHLDAQLLWIRDVGSVCHRISAHYLRELDPGRYLFYCSGRQTIVTAAAR